MDKGNEKHKNGRKRKGLLQTGPPNPGAKTAYVLQVSQVNFKLTTGNR